MLLFSPLKNQQSLLNMVFYPLRLSWYSTVEIIKNPLTAVFGIGVDITTVRFLLGLKILPIINPACGRLAILLLVVLYCCISLPKLAFLGWRLFCLMFYHLARQAEKSIHFIFL
jgi:hypothetical protein